MARVKTTPEMILAAIEARIVAVSGLAAAYVFTTLADDDELTSFAGSTQFVTVKPDNFPVDQGLAAGAGTAAVGTDSTCVVTLWTRLPLDQPGRDFSYLREATKGALDRWNRVMAGLHVFDPADGSANRILEEPMRCRVWRNAPRKPRLGWGKIEGTFEVRFLYDLVLGGSRAVESGDYRRVADDGVRFTAQAIG